MKLEAEVGNNYCYIVILTFSLSDRAHLDIIYILKLFVMCMFKIWGTTES